MTATLKRETFRTSRLLEFCNRKELTAQTGHSPDQWPLVIEKESIDNALDACEEAAIAPEIDITVATECGAIEITDNGPGIPPEVVTDILDYSVRVSSREAYVSPTRGAQGNALKTVLAMGFVLDGNTGCTTIESRGVCHTIRFRVNQLRQEPAIEHLTMPSIVEKGTKITIGWPHSARSILADAEERFLQIADDFAWLNPHLRIKVTWDGVTKIDRTASNLAWQKWRACDPTSAHWYDRERFERYIAARVSRDQDNGRDRLVREFISSELRGFSGSAKQKSVLNETGLARAALSSLFHADGSPTPVIEHLLGSLKKNSQIVKPALLGLIGKDHLEARFIDSGIRPETFQYEKFLAASPVPDAAQRSVP
jgi:DNA topoisomerase VI subunit B